jgi:hypothetical protein
MKHLYLLIVYIFSLLPWQALTQEANQIQFSGIVIDAEDRLPLAFVNILSNGKRASGGITDLDGSFELSSIPSNTPVTFSYVGYRPIAFTPTASTQDTVIRMYRDLSSLPVFDVIGKRNPGPELVAKLVDALPAQNPNLQLDFSCEVYTKLKIDLTPNDSIQSDSVKQRIEKVTGGGHMMLMESVAKYTHKAPNLTEQEVIAHRASGFEKPDFAVMLTDFQPFGFYDRYVELVDEAYLSPLTKKGLRNYSFRCRDTIIHGNDSTFLVSYEPKSYGADRYLSGLIYIGSNGSILENIIARPALEGLVDFEIEQSYAPYDAGVWYPAHFRFALTLKEYPSGSIQLQGESTSSIKAFQKTRLKRTDISPIATRNAPEAWARDTSFWDERRPQPLSGREKLTYEHMDSVGRNLKFDYLNQLSTSLTTGSIPLGPIDVSLPQLLVVNRYENFRPGLRLATNDRFLKRVSLNGYFGYGIADRTPKYTAGISLTPSRRRHVKIDLQYFNTLAEVGNHYNLMQSTVFRYRDLLGDTYDRLEGVYLRASYSITRNLEANTWFIGSTIAPQYNGINDAFEQSELTQTNVGLSFHYTAQTQAIKQGFQTAVVSKGYPRASLQAEHGISALGGDLDFWKLTGRMTHRFQLIRMLQTEIHVAGGFIDRPLPFGMLFTGQGSSIGNFSLFVPFHFQTLGLYEFTSDRYAKCFVKQELIALLKRNTISSPILSLEHGSMFGSLMPTQTNGPDELNAPKAGFHESGLKIDRLLRLKYVNLIYLDFGIGAYYRYGPYTLPSWEDNLALRFGIQASTR